MDAVALQQVFLISYLPFPPPNRRHAFAPYSLITAPRLSWQHLIITCRIKLRASSVAGHRSVLERARAAYFFSIPYALPYVCVLSLPPTAEPFRRWERAVICQWRYELFLLTHNKSRTAARIFIKFGLDAVSLAITSNSCLLISYSR
jgi:hypothetical protein